MAELRRCRGCQLLESEQDRASKQRKQLGHGIQIALKRGEV